ncbi:hypothetical protein PybrP1_001230 [[Pythium] brassicae (nom. inval.)]|nr:hypothetical protein PybrP1_001230 [[Pythium] brassicae (nom. inval.)]
MHTRKTPVALLSLLLLIVSVTLHATSAATHIRVRIHKEETATGNHKYNASNYDYDYYSGGGNSNHPQLPVFFFHGATVNASVWGNYAKAFTADKRAFHALAFCPDTCSVGSLNQQVTLAIAQIRAILAGPDAKLYAAGYVFVGHSQGAVLARAVVEDMDDHKAVALVSLAGPHNGVFYGPQAADAAPALAFLKRSGPSSVPTGLFDFAKYSTADLASGAFQFDFNDFVLFQYPQLLEQASLLGLARSPLAADWAAASPFLPRINNLDACGDDRYVGSNKAEKTPTAKCRSEQQRRRTNFLKLRRAHFFGSAGDEVVAPWQSAILGSYNDVSCASHIRDRFAHFRVRAYAATDEYTRNSYGLKALHERGDALFLHAVPAVAHSCWLVDVAACRFQAVFDEFVYPVFKGIDAARVDALRRERLARVAADPTGFVAVFHGVTSAHLPGLQGTPPRMNRSPVGLHPSGSSEVWVPAESLARVLSIFTLRRRDLSVFVHPVTAQQRVDHSPTRAFWLGPSWSVDGSALPPDPTAEAEADPPFQYPELGLGYSRRE